MKIEKSKAREVSRAHLENIGWEPRIGAADVFSVAWREILHSNRLRDLAIECVEDLRAGGLLVDVAKCVEVPIVVVPKGGSCL